MFSTSIGNELWVMVLEKVWAKCHITYQNIIEGRSYEVYRDLLGAPSFYHKTNIEDCYEIIKNALANKHECVCTSNSSDVDFQILDTKGLLENHTYSVL